MRIVYVAPSYYPRIGGVEYVVKSVAERMAKMGHEVTVVAGEPEAEKPREEEINGVYVIRWPTWAPGGAYHIPKKRNQLRSLLQRPRLTGAS
jgi:glycosyltransferase involved in cell wall biosynthesis